MLAEMSWQMFSVAGGGDLVAGVACVGLDAAVGGVADDGDGHSCCRESLMLTKMWWQVFACVGFRRGGRCFWRCWQRRGGRGHG